MIKTELVRRQTFKTRDQARRLAVFSYIEAYTTSCDGTRHWAT